MITSKTTSSRSFSGGEKLRPVAVPDVGLITVGKRLWLASAWLFGMLVSWSFLAPQDATSCFVGDAQAQNLFWMLTGVCAATGAGLGAGAFRMPSWERWLAMVCLCWLVYVSWRAGLENNARTAWFGFWQCLALASCYYTGRGLLPGIKCRAAALQILLVGCYATAVLGLYQVAVEFPQARAQYAEEPERFLQQAGIDAPPGSPLRKRFEDRLLSPEPRATFALANSLAVVLSAGLILGLGATGVALGCSGLFCPRWPDKLMLLLGVVILGATWFLTLSRTAYLAVLLALGLWGLQAMYVAKIQGLDLDSMVRRKSLRTVRRGAVAVGMAVVAGVGWLLINNRFVLSEAGKSLSFRLDYWRATWHMLLEYGWSGVGLGNFQSYYPRYMLPTASETIADPHNWLLDMAATLSVPIASIVAVWLTLQLFRAGHVQETQVASTLPAAPLGQGGGGGRPADGATTAARVDFDQRDADLANWITYGSAGGGAICLLLLVLLSGFDFVPLATAALVATALGWRTRPLFVELINKPTGALRSAVVAIVVCLLVSGSWQASGIAVPLLIVLLCLRPTLAEVPSNERRGVSESVLTVAVPLTGMVVFVLQSWMPVTASWSNVQQAGVARSRNEQLELARRAQQADPLDSDRGQFVTQLLFSRSMDESPELFPRASAAAWDALEAWLKRDQSNYLNWQFAGDRALELAAKAELSQISPTKYLQGARDFYRMAIVRYPTNCQLHLQLASVLAIQDEWGQAQAELVIAESLSNQTPHLDRKLEAQLVWLPFAPSGLKPILGESGAPTTGWYPAEPVAAWIRNSNAVLP